jgi:agmatinase
MDETLRRLERVTSDVVNAGKIPVMLGGEHTMTLAAIRAIGPDVGVVNFDAHGDLRDEYSALKTMHATFMRRVAEFVGPERIVEFGLRALCLEEIDYIRKHQLKHLTSPQILEGPLNAIKDEARKMLEGFRRIYVTVDMDVFDPAFAPGVGNPEADGLTPTHFFSLLTHVLKNTIVGFDVVETSPDYDPSGATAVLASRVIFEIISGMETTKG